MEANTRTADLLTDSRPVNSHPPALDAHDVHDYKALYETEKALREQERRTLRQILAAKDVKPTEKVTLSWIVLEATTRKPDGNRVVFDDLTEEALAKQLDLSKGTAGAALRALADAHIIDRPQTHSEAVDRAGNPLNGRRAFSKELGDWWRKPSLTIVSLPLPSPIPPTSTSQRAQKVRERSAHERELARVAVKLMQIACPDCGAVGEWHLTCGACGSTHVADALAKGEGLVDERVEVKHSHRNSPELSMGETFTHRKNAETTAITTGETPTGATGETFTCRESVENAAITTGTPATVQNPTCIPPMGQNLTCQEEGAERGECGVGAVPLRCEISVPGRIDFQALTAPRAMTGAETIHWLASIPAFEAGFVLVGKHSKNPLEEGWQKNPRTQEDALAHLARGGNVGLLCGRKTIAAQSDSAGMGGMGSMERWLVVIDLDSELEEFIAHYPQFAQAPRIYRSNAPDKMKLIIFATGETPPIRHFRKADKKRPARHDVDLLSAGTQAVIAGTHGSGETIRFIGGGGEGFVEMPGAELDAIVHEWAGVTEGEQPKKASSPAAAAAMAICSGDGPIQWWNSLPENNAAVDRLLARCKHRGQFVSIRPDDDTPSTKEAGDAYARTVKRIWRDYGTSENLDTLEMYCRLTGIDKTYLIQDVIIPAYKKAIRRN